MLQAHLLLAVLAGPSCAIPNDASASKEFYEPPTSTYTIPPHHLSPPIALHFLTTINLPPLRRPEQSQKPPSTFTSNFSWHSASVASRGTSYASSRFYLQVLVLGSGRVCTVTEVAEQVQRRAELISTMLTLAIGQYSFAPETLETRKILLELSQYRKIRGTRSTNGRR